MEATSCCGGALAVFAIGLSRIVLGVQWVSDVLGGRLLSLGGRLLSLGGRLLSQVARS